MKPQIIHFPINHQNYHLIIAETQKQRYQGLMFVRELIQADGMIFLFPDSDFRIFSNRNTLMDLEVYWLQDNQVIEKDFLPAFEKAKEIIRIHSPEKVNIVVEIPV